ncbi:chromosome partitioning protein ParB [Thiospirochaeta perfilievii]|uniref:Chromosome partitioning protein ParB n=1 Tax=Thiospirochaeta perfilievii TaxID=252967 RepID=A0A5C1QF18_9SPIO|nr:ParB N-terminal domain-containing protein [Thiospirochaeta perfilievii]QEN05997.1 chromosome partitioning protein ParB [Thiospirochaeta perfilievii]
MLVKIAEIRIKKRIRIDIGDLEVLKDSLNKYGLFHPIIINDRYELISGFRRLESAKQLGWQLIETKVIDDPSKIELIERELEENLVRKDFTDYELQSAYQRLKKLQNPSFFSKIINCISNFFNKLFKKK